jgi:hypothetical protein
MNLEVAGISPVLVSDIYYFRGFESFKTIKDFDREYA